jgi:tRNA-2-methylthio-N6-dimethylallyladenosine synthase
MFNPEKARTFYIRTFGCQMNKHDSERISGLLISSGYSRVNNPLAADVVIFNTCCVRESAVERFLGNLRELSGKIKLNPAVRIAVVGCIAQDMGNQIFEIVPQVDIVVGTGNLNELPLLLEQCIHSNEKISLVSSNFDSQTMSRMPFEQECKFRAWVPISYGCSNYCSYCIVPYVRGNEVSRNPGQIMDEIMLHVQNGVKEITLLGQNVNSYSSNGYNFFDLLDRVSEFTDLKRIRFATSHPKDLSGSIVELIALKDNICKHIHLPVQSGSNKILTLMNRGYDREYYIDTVNYIRAKIPGCSLTTDIIVGFPGETERDFEDTLDLVKKCRFDQSFTFIFSPRRNTKAAQFPDEVARQEKVERLKALTQIQDEIALFSNFSYLGREEEILIDGVSKKKRSEVCGRTDSNKVVNAAGCADLIGKFVNVKIYDAGKYSLHGKIII